MGRMKLNMKEKTRALTLLGQGMPGKRVAEKLSVNRRSIYRLKMEAAKVPPNTTPPRKPGSGGKRKTTPKTDCILKREVKKNPSITATELKNIHPELLKNVSIRTIQHRLQKDLKLPCRRATTYTMAEQQQQDSSKDIVLMKSEEMPEGTPIVKGYDFNEGIDYHKLFNSFRYSGFQATSFGQAVEEIKKMIACREKPLTQTDNLVISDNIAVRNNCTIFLGYTSNMASCGVRETIRFLVEHRMVDCLVSTAGGVEEDLIKCLAPTYLGGWYLKGRDLRLKGINRIGNLLVPNNNYCKFEDWVMPILDAMLKEQKEEGMQWTPSKMITRLGKEIKDKSSIVYWAAQNNIPIFSPALTDGSLGDMIYFHGIKNPGLRLDIAQDLHLMNQLSKKSINTGMIIVGGGLVKHHICNSNLMRNGANFSVFLNTASEWDGSDSGARPDEAVSWGKIKLEANPVKIYGEASFVFPLLVGETFATHYHQQQQQQ